MVAPTSFRLQILVLAALLLSASGEENPLSVVEECSRFGQEVGHTERSCEGLEKRPIPLQGQLCLPAAKLACSYATREWKCEVAAENARTVGKCSGEPSEEWDCCTACLLGQVVGASGATCLSSDMTFGTLREGAFASCCQQNSPDPTSSTSGEDTGTRNVCEELAGELCAHICLPTQGSYRCACRPGFNLMSDGKSCTPEIGRCEGCSYGCKERGNKMVCTCPHPLVLGPDNLSCIPSDNRRNCPAGYRSNGNQPSICEDVDECTQGGSNCDLTRERCMNTIGSFSCIALPPGADCKPGYHFNHVTGDCQDIDECLERGEDPPCDSNQLCENTVGSFTCLCKTGFRRDPITLACIDINECQLNLHNCASFQRCDNAIGSFHCVRDISCGTGYTLNHQSGNCEDDDECELGTDTCRFLGPDWECRNRVGSFRCVRKIATSCNGVKCGGGQVGPCSGDQCSQIQLSCPAGYALKGQTCEDINECDEGLARCGPNQRCVNIRGNYLCSDLLTCQSGFKLNEAKTQCTDINECEEQEGGICSHYCENRWGSYRCHCRPGYVLHSDNRTCLDINECEQRIRCQGFCINQPGSYSCGCPPGYRLTNNKHSCQDINECETTPGICQEQNEICINIAGSYRCNSVVCPPGYHRDGSRRRRCQRDNLSCRVDDTECKKQPATYTYDHITMVSNYSIPRSGSIKLFTVESRWGSTSPDFKLDMIQARVPPGTRAASREDFNLNKEYGRATIELLRPLYGPQDIQLELKTEFSNNNVFLGVSVFYIEIFVSQYSF